MRRLAVLAVAGALGVGLNGGWTGIEAWADTEEAVKTETAAEATAEAQGLDRPIPKGFTYVPEDMREGLEASDAAEFDTLLVRPGTDFSTYDKVYLEPLMFDFVVPRIEEGVTSSDMIFLDRTMSRQLQNVVGKNTEIVEDTGEGVLVLALTLTDARPNRDILGTFPTQRGGRAVNLRSVGIGGVIIEGIFTDGATGEIVAVTKHRFDGIALQSNTNLFTRWGDARDGMRIYMRRLRDLLK